MGTFGHAQIQCLFVYYISYSSKRGFAWGFVGLQFYFSSNFMRV